MHDHAATVRAIYDRFGQGDIEGLLQHLDPDIEWEHDWGIEPPPLYAPGRGHERVVRFFTDLQDYEFLRFEPVAILAGDEIVAVPIHFELRHKASGRTVSDLEVHLWTFGADGRATRLRHVLDPRGFG